MQNPVFAKLFLRLGARNEARGLARLRQELLAGLAGTVVEAGPGTGLNFPHYPDTVVRLVAVEPEPTLRAAATDAARRAPVPVEVVEGTAERLPVATGTADAVVISGVLCSVPDPRAALDEFRRVLRPGGELRFLEHVRGTGVRGRWQDLADVVWPRLMGGCHPNRDALAALREAGWQPVRRRELTFPPGARVSVVAPRVLGVARVADTGDR
ncbi:hypothetical protein BAY60_21630 [Prauserella muralis]|uniref:Methyltransferase type 11 domain-containing protein n=1 Tax=Prauserella muralis TaxID=588067 RepID=A0A2V4AQE7_9PSEU|nr:hypothetical protein BAY60_21630 [Prauserella muralis]TWE28129.1 methyltransferase family protein [Prauserella muralis]